MYVLTYELESPGPNKETFCRMFSIFVIFTDIQAPASEKLN